MLRPLRYHHQRTSHNLKMSEQQQDIAQKIAAARHLSESLKDKIRAKKEQTADSTCESIV